MHTIYISAEDNARLRLLLLRMPFSTEVRGDVRYLCGELDRAVIVHNPAEHPDVVQIGSTFECHDLRSADRTFHTLCLPADVSQTANGLSILTRFGAAVIGCSIGDEVAWTTPVGVRRILILGVIPPALAASQARVSPEPEPVS